MMRKFIKDQTGTTSIEYVLIASGIALGIFVTIFAFGGEVANLYDQIGGINLVD